MENTMTTISAKIIADSISQESIRITTYELEFPRFLLPQFNTHRLFSRNAQSSRAIPIKRQIELIEENPAMPSHWGKHQPGMQAAEEHNAVVDLYSLIDDEPTTTREEAWLEARDQAVEVANAFAEAGYHKQIVNRILEPFAHIKVVVTATEYDNFFWLRKHPDAQPEIKELAERMWEAREASNPNKLMHGEWHVPYYKAGHTYKHYTKEQIQEALMISSSCCAQVSYRRTDESLEKAQKIYKALVESKPVHASPFEHQATPMLRRGLGCADRGTTHESYINNKPEWWSGNFRGWVQHRQLINEHTCWEYKDDKCT